MKTGHENTAHKIRERIRTAALAAVIVCASVGTIYPLRAQTPSLEPTFHPESRLPVNGRVILTGTTQTLREFVIAIEDHSPALVAEQDTVPLWVENRYRNDGQQTQVVLAPERLLTPGRTYRLSAARFVPGTEEAAWFVEDRVDSIPPEWNGPAAYIGGCHREGESHYAYIALPLSEAHADEIAIEATVVEDSGEGTAADTLRLLLFPRANIVEEFSGAILVSDKVALKLDPAPQGGQYVGVPEHLILPFGDGIYGGGFALEAGRTYRVSMAAVDAAGNRSSTREGIIRVPAGDAPVGGNRPTTGSGTTGEPSFPPHQPLIPTFEEDGSR